MINKEKIMEKEDIIFCNPLHPSVLQVQWYTLTCKNIKFAMK
uniref:Uncharacterized protein n=1 Tax=Lepeophtheirus salmonis TaxID=72036 RepID=A0A0K2U8C0_LEPSM